MLSLLRLLLALALTLGAVTASASSTSNNIDNPPKLTTITLPMHPSSGQLNHEDYYFTQLLRLALDKTLDTDGPYQLLEADVWLTDNRLKAALKTGHLDVIWSATSPEFELALLPVRVSLLKDLGDYRVFIIRPGEQQRFDGVKSLDDLRKFTGGIGSQWTDASVMRANDLPVVSSVGYGRLFKMLAAGRFDYFSRGVYQVSHEVDFYPKLGLVIEQRLMLHYPSPHYFFVNRTNSVLADRLARGLKLAQDDGSFDKLFNRIPRHQWAQLELRKKQRLILKLKQSSTTR